MLISGGKNPETMHSDSLPYVSILVPVYKVENYIERCARSVFEQTYPNIEYIFCDDGSPDRSIEVLERVMKDYPERAAHTQIIRFPENRGLSIARNTLVDNCQTEWLMHVDSDDWVERDIVENMVKKQQETGADMVISDFVFEKENGQERFSFIRSDSKEDHFYQFLSNNDSHVVWGKLLRTAIIKEHNIRAIEHWPIKGEDWQVIVPIAYFSEKIVVTSHLGYHYEKTRDSALSHKSAETLPDYYKGIKTTLDFISEFLKDKHKSYRDTFDKTYFERMCFCMTLGSLFNNKDIHHASRSKASQIIVDSKLSLNAKEFILFKVKSNYFIYKRFIHFMSAFSA